MDSVLSNLVESVKIAWLMLWMKCGGDRHRYWKESRSQLTAQGAGNEAVTLQEYDYDRLKGLLLNEQLYTLEPGHADARRYDYLAALNRRATREEQAGKRLLYLKARRQARHKAACAG